MDNNKSINGCSKVGIGVWTKINARVYMKYDHNHDNTDGIILGFA